MTENVNSPFPTQKPAPILVRRWRTIVDVHGTRYALDVTASYSLLEPELAVEVKAPPAPAAAATKPPRGADAEVPRLLPRDDRYSVAGQCEKPSGGRRNLLLSSWTLERTSAKQENRMEQSPMGRVADDWFEELRRRVPVKR